MAKALDAEALAARAADVFAFDRFGNPPDFFERQFARQNEDVGKLRVEANRAGIRDAQLRREVHFDPALARGGDRRRIRRNHGRNPRFGRSVEHLFHERDFPFVDDGIEREIGFCAFVQTARNDFGEVVERDARSALRAHVEGAGAEIHRVGAARESGGDGVETAGGRHDFVALRSVSVGHGDTVPSAATDRLGKHRLGEKRSNKEARHFLWKRRSRQALRVFLSECAQRTNASRQKDRPEHEAAGGRFLFSALAGRSLLFDRSLSRSSRRAG